MSLSDLKTSIADQIEEIKRKSKLDIENEISKLDQKMNEIKFKEAEDIKKLTESYLAQIKEITGFLSGFQTDPINNTEKIEQSKNGDSVPSSKIMR